MASKIDKNDIDNLLIYSSDRWSLVESSVVGKTPKIWWTASQSFYDALPDGTVKAAHMPCALLYQVGEMDNQRATCNSIDVDVDSAGIVTSASVGTTVTVSGRNFTKLFNFDMTQSFHYPFGMKSADMSIPDPSADDADDFDAFAAAVDSVADKGSFEINHIVVGTGGSQGDNGGLDTISQVLTALNSGDMTTAASSAATQTKMLSAEGYSAEDSSADYDPTIANPTTTPATPSGFEPAEMAAEDANVMDIVTEPGTTAGVQGAGSAGYTSIGEGHGVTESFGKGTWPVPETLLSAEGEMESLEQATVADELTVETIPGGSEDALGGGPGISPMELPADPSDYVTEDLDARIEAWMAETATHDPYEDEVPYAGPGNYSGADVSFDAEIGKDVKRPGALSRKAKRAGMSVAKFSQHVMANPKKYSKLTRQQAGFFHNVLAKGSKTSAARSKVRADYRRKGYLMAESPVTWEGPEGLSSPSSPPDDIFMADQVDEIYGYGHIVGQTGSTWTTSPLMAEDVEVPFLGQTDVKSAVVGVGLGLGLMALLARFKK